MSRSNLQSQVASEMSPLDAAQNPSTVPPPKTPKTTRSTTSPTAQMTQPETTQHPTKRKTTIITEYFDSPTVYEGSPPDSHSPRTDRSRKSHIAHNTDAAPGTLQMDDLRRIPPHILMSMPGVSIKEYAAASPLPESRGTTMIGSPKAATRLNVSQLPDFPCSCPFYVLRCPRL